MTKGGSPSRKIDQRRRRGPGREHRGPVVSRHAANAVDDTLVHLGVRLAARQGRHGGDEDFACEKAREDADRQLPVETERLEKRGDRVGLLMTGRTARGIGHGGR